MSSKKIVTYRKNQPCSIEGMVLMGNDNKRVTYCSSRKKTREEVLHMYKHSTCKYMIDMPCNLENCTLDKCERAHEKFSSISVAGELPRKHKIFVEMGEDYYKQVCLKSTSSKYKTSNYTSGRIITRESPSIFSDAERDAINEGIAVNKRGESTITYPVDISTEDEEE